MYLSKLPNWFVQITKYICPNCQIYLFKLANVFVQILKCICPNCKIFLSKFPNIFFSSNGQIFFWLNYKIYLFITVFFQNNQWFCPTCKMYLSKFPNIFVQISKYICSNLPLGVFLQLWRERQIGGGRRMCRGWLARPHMPLVGAVPDLNLSSSSSDFNHKPILSPSSSQTTTYFLISHSFASQLGPP